MAKDPAEQQKTDAQRIGDTGSGKLDETEMAPVPEPLHRESVEGGLSPDAAHADRDFLEAARSRLERERRIAIERLRQLGVSAGNDEEAPRAGTDTVLEEGDEAQASERNDMQFMTRERVAERINRLTAALERVQQGQYGRCLECGRPIGRARLAAMPEADTCLAYQQRRDARAADAAA